MRSVRKGHESRVEQGSRKMVRMYLSRDKHTPETNICNMQVRVATAIHYSPLASNLYPSNSAL